MKIESWYKFHNNFLPLNVNCCFSEETKNLESTIVPSTSTSLFTNDVCKCMAGSRVVKHHVNTASGGSDRLGYNLICIADRVISIRVTAQSSLPVEERSVYLKWVAHSTGRLFCNYLPACKPCLCLCRIRFSHGVAFIPLYRRLQNNRANVVTKRKLPNALSVIIII